MKNIIGAIFRRVPVMLRDLTGLGAIGSIAYGAWQIYAPAGFIVGGALVLACVVLMAAGGR